MTPRRLVALFAVLLSALALSACGSDKKDDVRIESTSAINGYLWRASVETLSFMPMLDVDPQAGAIITDWFVNPDTPNERMKVSVFILGNQLRADTLKVAVVRQERNGSGIWTNQPVRAGTELQIEDTILARARQLRIDALNN